MLTDTYLNRFELDWGDWACNSWQENLRLVLAFCVACLLVIIDIIFVACGVILFLVISIPFAVFFAGFLGWVIWGTAPPCSKAKKS